MSETGLLPSYACKQPDAPPGEPVQWENMKRKASPGVLPDSFEWGCLAGYQELPVPQGELFKNRMLVFAFGNTHAAKLIRVALAVNDPPKAQQARSALAKRVSLLTKQLASVELPGDVAEAIQRKDAGTWTIGDLPAGLKRVPLGPGGAEGGYWLHFELDLSRLGPASAP